MSFTLDDQLRLLVIVTHKSTLYRNGMAAVKQIYFHQYDLNKENNNNKVVGIAG